MKKTILGLDLGTTSIGWALVQENDQNSKILCSGVRLVPLSTDERINLETGKSVSINAERTLKRSMRRNLQRYKLRRKALLQLLRQYEIIDENFTAAEKSQNNTLSLWQLRSLAAIREIELEDFARVLLSINKKRGYKSNRKVSEEEGGNFIEGMEVARILHRENLTPGQWVYHQLKQGKKNTADFYPSDLQAEWHKIWKIQQPYYPEKLNPELLTNLQGKGKKQCWAICKEVFGLEGLILKGKAEEIQFQKYELRAKALKEQLQPEFLAIVLSEISGQIAGSSGYLGAISDRSKELYFSQQTVGQYLYKRLLKDPNNPVKNLVFYRQDYLDEFEKIWGVQSANRKDILTDTLKEKIRDIVIFYQRRLKSQKGLIAICELEGREMEIQKDGKTSKKLIGPRVIPRSSPLFQEFKIWQILNNLKLKEVTSGTIYQIDEIDPDLQMRKALFTHLTYHSKMSASAVIKAIGLKPKEWEITNYDELQGDSTKSVFYKAFVQMAELSGHDVKPANLNEELKAIFSSLGINTCILDFDSSLKGQSLEYQAYYQLWHLLYAYEGDQSKSGNETLNRLLLEKFGIPNDLSAPLAAISFNSDYGHLSTRAIRKILPNLKRGLNYTKACEAAGYRHSNYITKSERKAMETDMYLELIPKNSLRNPIVEKILNQMIHVVNAIINKYGYPDSIHVEMARELKKNAKERERMYKNMGSNQRENENIRELISQMYPFKNGVRITRNDIIRYKLYEELSFNGYRSLYTNQFIPKEKIFGKEIDIEHIIPKARVFDDSFANKTLAYRQVNLDKGNKTAYDFLIEKYGEDSPEFDAYRKRVEAYLKASGENAQGKHKRLLTPGDQIKDGFIDRDLRNTQYIAKKAISLLQKVCKDVLPTTGSITARLREDWQLNHLLRELNMSKYQNIDFLIQEKTKDGQIIDRIKDWSKRDDHRHHAVDALVVAFTQRNHIQYLNYLNARFDNTHSKHTVIRNIENLITYKNDKDKRLIKPPIPLNQFRQEAKKHLDNVLISLKAKNKVVTRNTNNIKTRSKVKKQNTLTPRGQLHKETIYGCKHLYSTQMIKVGPKFTEELIAQVASKKQREALMKRLAEFDDNPKKAFGGANSPSKNPIYLNDQHSDILPEKVKLVQLQKQFTIRKQVGPDLKLDKVVDIGIRRILQKRVDKFGGNAKKAFSNLEEDPIWLNRDKGIAIKRVTITGVANAEALHHKKDHLGQEILDKNQNTIPTDYVSTGNNHHVAIYQDANGKQQEKVVSFFEAVSLKQQGLEVVDKNFKSEEGWNFLFSLKQNEYFVFPNENSGFNPNEIDLLNTDNYAIISPNLFRVQKISSKNYVFNHHLETQAVNGDTLKNKKLQDVTYRFIQTPDKLKGIVKVRINHLGNIVHIGES